MPHFTFTTSLDIPYYTDTAVLVTAECVDPGEPASYNDPGWGPDIRIRSVIIDDLDDHPLNGSILPYDALSPSNQEYLWFLAHEKYDPRDESRCAADSNSIKTTEAA